MGKDLSLDKSYSLIASFQNFGERILFTFSGLYADEKGATASEQGILLSLRNILSFMAQQLFGRASDRYGRTVILAFGFLLSAVSSYLMFNVTSPISIIVVFAFYSLGFSAIQPAWSALIGDTYAENERSKMLGHIGAIASLAGGVIYLGAGLLSEDMHKPYTFLFGTAAVSFLGAFTIVLFLAWFNKVPQHEEPEKRDISTFEPLTNRSFRKFVLIDAVYAFTMATTWPLFPKVTNELASTSQVSIMWFLAFLGFSVTAKYTPQIRDYIGSYNRSMYISRAFLWLVPFSFAFATSWVHLVFARMVAG
ncbi:MAG: MFS transporter, partial [Candidatus Kariarchaeaceae archaeon]